MKIRFGVEYPWAVFNKTNALINIGNAQKSTDHSFFCPDCGSDFIPCQGKYNSWYFKHKDLSDELVCVDRSISHDMVNYFKKYDKFESIISNFIKKYPDFTPYKKIKNTLYPLVNNKTHIIVDFVDFRGIKNLENRIKNAEDDNYEVLLVSAYHLPQKKTIESSRDAFKPFTILEFNTQQFHELFTSMKEHGGIITIDTNADIQSWKQCFNPKYFNQVTQSDQATAYVLNYLEGNTSA